MADHDEHDDHGGGPAGGAPDAPTGKPAKGKGKGLGGLLHGPHATEIIVVCSVAGVLLAWMTLHKSSAAASTAPANSLTAQAAGLAGTGSVAGFDQSAYAGLQTLLENQRDQLAALSAQVGNAGGLPTGAGSAPSLPSPLPTPPATATPSGGGTVSTQPAGPPTILPATSGGSSAWHLGVNGPYATPTTGVRGPVGSPAYSPSGSTIGTVTGYTFNGLPATSYKPGTSMADALASGGAAGSPVWTKTASGYVNQWGNVTTGFDKYGTPL